MTDAKDSQLCMYLEKKPLQLLAFQKETSSITDNTLNAITATGFCGREERDGQ
jgi:hypothetical protein